MKKKYTVFIRRKAIGCLSFIIFCNLSLPGYGEMKPMLSPSHISAFKAVNVHGVVTGTANDPLPGVSVAIKGTTRGTTTDANGNYELADVPDDAVLVFSYIGYERQEVKVDSRIKIDVRLNQSQTTLNQLVVVGYGTQKQSNLTGAISVVDMDKKAGQPITNASNALYGVPGLYVNLNHSEPGTDRAAIQIRGMGTLSSNAPLVLVDGIEYPMDEVDPDDIASITVLKDASASIYGSKAANGVILITTKKGSGKSKVNYSFYYGIQQPTILSDLVWDPIVYMKSLNQAEKNEGKEALTFSDKQIQGYELGMKIDPLTYPSNNWYDIALRNGIIRKHDLSVSGGTEKYDYRFSIGYLNRHGIVFGPGNSENKYSLGLSSSVQVSKRLRIGASIHGYYRDYTQPSYGTDEFWSDFGRVLPIQNDTLKDGSYGYPFLRIPGRNNWENPRMIAYEGSYRKTVLRYLTTLQATYHLPFGLTYNVKFGADKYDGLQKQFIPLMVKYEAKTGEPQYFNSAATAPRAYSYDDNELNIHFYNTLNWHHLFAGKHDVTAMIGGSYDNYVYDQSGAEITGYSDATLTALSVGLTPLSISGNTTHETLESAFGRVNYSYNNKYLLEAIFRYDGSSRLAPQSRWGFFPAVSAGWRIVQEPFFHVDFINSLKLRASVGQLGNQAVDLYSYENTITLGHDYSFGGPNGVLASGAAATAYSDPHVTWETTTDYDAGLDAAFWHNRIGLTVDVYKKWTTGILRRVNLPSQVGDLSGPVKNVGTVRNIGYEIGLNFHDHIGSFHYGVSGNISYNKNEVINLNGEVLYNYSTNLSTITKKGYPIDAFYVLKAVGIFQSDEEVAKSAFQSQDTQAGYIKYEDVNGDGIINGDDRVIIPISSVMPKYNYAFGIDLSYKGVGLTAQFQGVSGIKEAPMNRPSTPLNNGADLTWEWVTDSWTPDRPNAKLPILTEANYGSTENFLPSTFWLKDASYLRLKTIQLQYTIPDQWLAKVKIEKLSVFINAENWLTITHFKEGDPEAMYNAIGISHYPMLKTINGGVNVTF
jgi:TonB-linked SusC/RagA family outer membrane protein